MAEGRTDEQPTPGWPAMPGGGGALWTRVALLATAAVTLAIAAALLVMTVAGLHAPH